MVKSMKLLFIQHGSRIRECENGDFYVDGNFNNNIWKRYKSYCDELIVILRKKNGKFKQAELEGKFNKIDCSLMKLITVEDIYSPKSNFINIGVRTRIEKIVSEEVKNADKVILRSAGDYYTDLAYKYVKKYNKPYLVEAIGFPFPSFWYHSVWGKIVALPIDIKFKKTIKNADYALYVTEEALQKRYPNRNKNIGCSDVEVSPDENIKKVIDNKINNIKIKNKIILGTAAFLNVRWKGQIDVLKALKKLKDLGINNYEYQLIGAGSPIKLNKYIEKYNLKENVKIIGALPHEKVYNWLEKIDIYIQPSYQEGLCRAIVEAMSKGCAVVATNVGGNYELVDKKYLYSKGNINQLIGILKSIKVEEIRDCANKNYIISQRYNVELLSKKRDRFYKDFTGKNE